ncbi:MAG: Rad52/Rad22 family DNA repair protein [Oscillospiraceae bacterium]
MEFKDLTKFDIDVRVCNINDKGASLLLYKDARCDMRILDEIVGAENWQRKHYECKGNLFCSVGINVNYDTKDAQKEWIWKDDCGSESNAEKEKGEASDSFKRACFNWGIGRELYTAPFIWVGNDDINITGKKTYDRFVVQKIIIEGGCITALAIYNQTKKATCFIWQKDKK